MILALILFFGSLFYTHILYHMRLRMVKSYMCPKRVLHTDVCSFRKLHDVTGVL